MFTYVNTVCNSTRAFAQLSEIPNKTRVFYSAVRQSSATAPIEARVLENGELPKKKILDYTKYISGKSLRREPSITRTLTSLAYKSGKNMISLAEGMPNESIFPFQEINIMLKEGTNICLKDKELSNALQYIPSQGLPILIKSLKEFQRIAHQPPNWPERDIIITSGSQDGIYKSIELLVNRGDPIIVPNPLYSGADIVMKPYQPRLLDVMQDSQGMIPEHLRDILYKCQQRGDQMPKVMYVNPTGQNPTGTIIPNSRRQEIYDIACEYDIIILEDDPYHFMYFSEEIPKSFISFDVEGRVLRFDSLSKILSSGLRIGWITGPQPLIDLLELHMQASYLHCSTLTQMITNKLLDEWGMKGMLSHLQQVRDFYKIKRDCLIKCMDKHLTGLAEWDVPEAGMFVWLKVVGVPDVYDMIVNKGIKKGITFAPGHAFGVSSKNEPCPYIRATYSRSTPADMEIACIKLAELIRDEQKLYSG